MTTLSVAVVGCGPHARKVAQAVLASGGIITGFLDERPDAKAPLEGLNVKLLGVAHVQHGDSAVVAVGNEAARRRISDELRNAGCELPVVVHRCAYVSSDAALGKGVVVLAGAIVESGARIGDGAIVDVGAIIDHDAVVLAFAHVRPGCVVDAYSTWPPVSTPTAAWGNPD